MYNRIMLWRSNTACCCIVGAPTSQQKLTPAYLFVSVNGHGCFRTQLLRSLKVHATLSSSIPYTRCYCQGIRVHRIPCSCHVHSLKVKSCVSFFGIFLKLKWFTIYSRYYRKSVSKGSTSKIAQICVIFRYDMPLQIFCFGVVVEEECLMLCWWLRLLLSPPLAILVASFDHHMVKF